MLAMGERCSGSRGSYSIVEMYLLHGTMYYSHYIHTCFILCYTNHTKQNQQTHPHHHCHEPNCQTNVTIGAAPSVFIGRCRYHHPPSSSGVMYHYRHGWRAEGDTASPTLTMHIIDLRYSSFPPKSRHDKLPLPASILHSERHAPSTYINN